MPWRILLPPQLPLAADPSDVAGFFQQVREGRRRARQGTEVQLIADIVEAGHELHPGRRAQRLHVAMLEAHAGSCQAVQVRRLV